MKSFARGSDLLLSSLKYVAIVQEERLHLVDTSGGNEDEVEDGKQPKLERVRPISHFPKRESTEQGGKDVQDDLVPHVILIGSANTSSSVSC